MYEKLGMHIKKKQVVPNNILTKIIKNNQSVSYTHLIMVTAANEAETVRQLLGAGIVDYLVKPFEYARFERALEAFSGRQELLAASADGMSQREIDSILKGGNADSKRPARMQKGLQEQTLETVRQYMRENPDKAVSYTHLDVYKRQNKLLTDRIMHVAGRAVMHRIHLTVFEQFFCCLLYTSRCV